MLFNAPASIVRTLLLSSWEAKISNLERKFSNNYMPSFKAAIKKICNSSSISNKLIYSVHICFLFLHLGIDPSAVNRDISVDSRIFRVSTTESPGGSANEGSYIVIGKIDGYWSTRVPLNINHDVSIELNLFFYCFISNLPWQASLPPTPYSPAQNIPLRMDPP